MGYIARMQDELGATVLLALDFRLIIIIKVPGSAKTALVADIRCFWRKREKWRQVALVNMASQENTVPVKRAKKVRNTELVREKKVQGAAHVNHRGKFVPAKEIGDDCRCARFKCFNVLSIEERQSIFQEFYGIKSKNLQDSHLCGLITLQPVKQRRSRKIRANRVLVEYSDSEDDQTLPSYEHAGFYSYRVRTKTNDAKVYNEIPICKKTFLSLHGITSGRLRRLQQSLCDTLKSPCDRRGKHNNRPNSLPTEITKIVEENIKSYKPRQSHYSLRKNPNRYYLPETLSVRSMYKSFLEEYHVNISYKAYWSVFHKKFNIKFGLPRTDTCSTCDSLIQKIAAAESDQLKTSLNAEKELHLRKAQAL
nr:unnamed protein product [Callosobruchus chinensis]